MYALYRIYPEYFDFKNLINESVKQLTETDENGNHVCDFLRYAGDPRSTLNGRVLDIAITYYPLAKLTNTEGEILSLLTTEQRYSQNRLKDTQEAAVFHAFIQCIESHASRNPLISYKDIMTSISTKEITDAYNINMENEGNNRTSLENITGNKVTRMLRDMGFDLKRGTANQTFITISKDFENVLDVNSDKFGSEEDLVILEKIRRKSAKS